MPSPTLISLCQAARLAAAASQSSLLRVRLAICGTDRIVLRDLAQAMDGTNRAPRPKAQTDLRLIFITIPPIDRPTDTLPGIRRILLPQPCSLTFRRSFSKAGLTLPPVAFIT